MRTALAGFHLEGNGGSWNPGAGGDAWSGGGGGCGGDCGCGGQCGGDCGCKGGGASCGGKPSGGFGDKPTSGCGGKPSGGGGSVGGGSGQLPLIPDYNGEIWDVLRSYGARGASRLLETGSDSGDYFSCSVNGVWTTGYRHPTKNSVCFDREFTNCVDCDGWQPPACPPYCQEMKQKCDAAERECNTACILILDEVQRRTCFNSCIAPAISDGGACSACKTCHGTYPSCPVCVTSYWGLPSLPPSKRDPNYDPNKDWCSEPLLDQDDVGDDANYCCFLHDKCYDVGGGYWDRMKCDLGLLTCLSLAWWNSVSIIGATAYFLGVRVGGVSHFNYHVNTPAEADSSDVPPPWPTPMQDAFGSPWGHMR